MILDKKANIGSHRVKVEMRNHVRRKIGDMVPDKQMVGYFTPSLDIVAQRFVLVTLAERLRKRTFDSAKANNHIFARFNFQRRLAGVLIGKRFHPDVGEFLFYRLGHFVYKADQRA